MTRHGCFQPGGVMPDTHNGSYKAAGKPIEVPPCALPGGKAQLPAEMLQPSIRQAFSGADVFVTGGTGFVGSVMIEQLLRLVPDVGTIFMLVRPKAGVSGEGRIDALLNKAALFDSLRVGAKPGDGELGVFNFGGSRAPLRPELRAKLRAVEGDVCKPDCGLSPSDLDAVRSRARFVVHCAASISFFEHVHVLIEQNYVATRNAVDLAMRCTALAGYVHVSTAYVNSFLPRGKHIEEKIYPLVMPDGSVLPHAETAMSLLSASPKVAAKRADEIVGALGFPNPYTLSKHLAEDLVAELHEQGRLNACIVRPSIVGANAGGPAPGYFGNTAGATSMILAFASGMATFSCHDPDNVFDLVPCDVVASAVLGAAAGVAAGGSPCGPGTQPLIVHASSSTSYCERYGYLFKNFIFDYWMANPPSRRFRKKYKPINHWTAWLPSKTLTFKAMTAWNSFKFAAIAAVLRRQGRPDLAFMISSGWRVWKLYNNEKLDFHVFYCSRVANEIMSRLPASEREDFRMVWSPPKDSWGFYMLRLCDVVRAKFFMGPKQLRQLLEEGGPKPLPPHVAANALADMQRWRTDKAATGGIVPRPGMPASSGTVEAMARGEGAASGVSAFDEALPAGVAGLLQGSANAPMSVSSRAIAPIATEDEEDDLGGASTSSGSEPAAAAATEAVVVKGGGCCDVVASPRGKNAKKGSEKKASKRGGRRGARGGAAVVA